MEFPPPLTYEQTSKVLAKLADIGERIVLVGGQALNFWANYYSERSSDLLAHAPFTSKDVDFFGSRKAVAECAARLGGTANLATLDDQNTPHTGVVYFVDEDRHHRVIDFLGSVAGLQDKDLEGLPAEITDKAGKVVATFFVIDPVQCLRSRAYNVARLPGYRTTHALKQLRAAIILVKEFARDILSQGDVKRANAVNNAVFELAMYGVGVEVYVDYEIDILDGLLKDPGLPEQFFTHRLKFATAAVQRARGRLLAARQREIETQAHRKSAPKPQP